MVFDLSPGDVVHIGDAVTLTVLAIEDDLIRFGLELLEGCPATGMDGDGATSSGPGKAGLGAEASQGPGHAGCGGGVRLGGHRRLLQGVAEGAGRRREPRPQRDPGEGGASQVAG